MRKKPEISQHALLRYLERHYGLDLDAVRDEMLSAPVRAAIKSGAASVKIGGMKFLITNHVVTTAVKPSQHPDYCQGKNVGLHRRAQHCPETLEEMRYV